MGVGISMGLLIIIKMGGFFRNGSHYLSATLPIFQCNINISSILSYFFRFFT